MIKKVLIPCRVTLSKHWNVREKRQLLLVRMKLNSGQDYCNGMIEKGKIAKNEKVEEQDKTVQR